MELKLKRVPFMDEWIVVNDYSLGQPYEFESYILGWRWEASSTELQIIREQKMFGRRIFQLRDDDVWFTFAAVLRPDWIPEVNRDAEALLRIEARLRKEAAFWTHWIEKER